MNDERPDKFFDPRARAFRPVGSRIRRLRVEKGWSREDLAVRSLCSPKTINNLERGSPARVYTLSNVAKALGVDYLSLLLDDGEKPLPNDPKARESDENLVPAAITIDKAKLDFDETKELSDLLKKLAEALATKGSRIILITIKTNSITLHLKMPKRAVFNLVELFANGRVSGLPRDIGVRMIALYLPPTLRLPLRLVADVSRRLKYAYDDGAIRLTSDQPAPETH